MSLAVLTDLRIDKISLTSTMNDGPEIKGKISFSTSSRAEYSVCGDEDGNYCLIGIDTHIRAKDAEENELADLKVYFYGKFDFESEVSNQECEELLGDDKYTDSLAMQLQPLVNDKVTDMLRLIGFNVNSTLSKIRIFGDAYKSKSPK